MFGCEGEWKMFHLSRLSMDWVTHCLTNMHRETNMILTARENDLNCSQGAWIAIASSILWESTEKEEACNNIINGLWAIRRPLNDTSLSFLMFDIYVVYSLGTCEYLFASHYENILTHDYEIWIAPNIQPVDFTQTRRQTRIKLIEK